MAGLILVLVALRLAFAGWSDLAPDETYYLLWSHYPSASYFDHPPMVAWWIAAGTWLFGATPLGVRFFFVVSLIPTSIAICLTGRLLFDRATGLRAALWTNATLLVGIGISATPDAPSMLFWALATWAFAAAIVSGRGAWWLAVGLFAGLGVASKLTDLFLGVGILGYLLAVRPARQWLRTPWPWAGGLVALAVLSPMLLWNMDHDWITFTKQMGRITDGGFQPGKFPEFLLTQFGILNPLVAIFAGLGIVLWARGRSGGQARGITLLVWSALPLVAYMCVYAFQEQVQGNWLAPVYPTVALIAAAAAAIAAEERWGGLRRLTFPLGVVLSAAGFILVGNPGGVLPPWLDAAQVVRGWPGVARDAERLRGETGARWIAVTHYAQGAAIAYHLGADGAPVIPVSERARYAFAPPPADDIVAAPGLAVTSDSKPTGLARCFATVEPVAVIERRVPYVAERFYAYRVKGPRAGLFDIGCEAMPPSGGEAPGSRP